MKKSTSSDPDVIPLVTTGAPLTEIPTAAVAAHPVFPPVKNPKVDLDAAAKPNASVEAVAAAFAQQWFRSDSVDADFRWADGMRAFTTTELQAQLTSQNQPPVGAQDYGIGTATVILVAQRSSPDATAASIPIVVQAIVTVVSPTGRVQSETTTNFVNVLLDKTPAGWKVSQLLGQAS